MGEIDMCSKQFAARVGVFVIFIVFNVLINRCMRVCMQICDEICLFYILWKPKKMLTLHSLKDAHVA